MSRAMLVLDTEGQRRKATDWVWAAKNGSRVEFKGPKRTLDQNSLMWALLTDIAVHMRKTRGLEYSTEDWKHIFLHGWGREVKFLPALDGKGVVPIPQSSSDLAKEEMTDFIEYILKEGAERGVTFHNTNDESPADPSTADDKAAEAETLQSSAADESSSQAADPAGGNSGDEPEQPSADLRLSDEDRAWLVTVFKTLKAAVGPDVDVLKRQALMFKADAESKSSLVKAKATKIRTELEKCCGENPASGTVAVGKYVAALIGADEKDLRT